MSPVDKTPMAISEVYVAGQDSLFQVSSVETQFDSSAQTQWSLVQRDAAMEAAKRYAGKARSENTWRGYRAAWPPAKLLAHGCQGGALSGLGDTVGYGVNIGGGGHGEASGI